ncbi:MAG: glycosyltransferase [Humidesulfovibrio sp.]|nr:glycosyltransferase [Humidesulfovibrio sp.]
MNENYFRIMAEGLHGELANLSPEDVLVHFNNYRANFLLDRTLTVCYLNRFLAAFNTEGAQCAREPLEYLLDKCLQFSPFDIANMRTKPVLDAPEARLKIEILDKTNFEPETFNMIAGLEITKEAQDISLFLRRLLEAFPSYALAAELLLAADFILGNAPDWLRKFKCPKRLQDDFNGMLFRHYAAMGHTEEAARLWELLPPAAHREVNLNFAAELARMLGDVPTAIARYERSLTLDKSQAAARFRLMELQSPSVKRAELVQKKKVAIYLYSYNKASVLKATLASLAASNIGGASITVLLNGCTDDSLAVAEWAKKLFPRNAFTIIPLHVNIGAPAARNWLINQPSTWETDYVAFLDDDVDVPEDWLEWYLSVAERDEKIAVVGGKIVFPGRPAKLQYLFRYVSVAKDDLLKLNLGAPDHQFDNGAYDFIRETRSVMGCLHLLRTSALREAPNFDIRFSPSQVDDIDHDLCLCLAGWKVMYCGLVTCVHHQSSGLGVKTDPREFARIGNGIGNDIKLFYKHFAHMDELRKLDNLSLLPWGRA